MSALEDFKAAYRADEVLFFAGAGASIDSKAPAPLTVLETCARLFLPTGPEFAAVVQDLLRGPNEAGMSLPGIQPEIFYEQLLALCGDLEVLAPWRILSPIWLAGHGAALAPNANHLALVDHAARSGLPLFTTNFDMLFEAAARRLGVEVDTVLPEDDPGTIPLDPAPGRLRLFKLHGSIAVGDIERLDSLRTTMQGITAINPPMLDRIAAAARGRALVFLGYSGCDIDYFPVLAGLPLDRRPYWFNPGQDKATRRHAERIGAREIDAFPSAVLAGLHPDFPARAPGPDTPALLTRLESEIPVWLSEPQKRLLLAQGLHGMGRHREADRVLTALESAAADLRPRDRTAMLLLRARLLDCLSRYPASIAAAEAALTALRSAARAGTLAPVEAAALKIRALYHREMARQQAIGPMIRHGDARLDWRPPALQMLIRLVLGLMLWRRLEELGRHLAGMARTSPGYSLTRAEHAINDHAMLMLGRVIAAAEAFRLVRLPWARRYLDRLLAALSDRASRNGDYFVHAAIRKYRRRLDGLDGPDEASETYGLLRDPLNYASVRRNAGVWRLLETGDRAGAATEFRSAVDAALACGSHATALKGLVGLASCEALTDADVATLEQEVGPAIESRGYRRYWLDRVAPFLASRRGV